MKLPHDLRSFWGDYSMKIDGFCGCCNPSHFAFLSTVRQTGDIGNHLGQIREAQQILKQYKEEDDWNYSKVMFINFVLFLFGLFRS